MNWLFFAFFAFLLFAVNLWAGDDSLPGYLQGSRQPLYKYEKKVFNLIYKLNDYKNDFVKVF